jgi:hypothetical protein
LIFESPVARARALMSSPARGSLVSPIIRVTFISWDAERGNSEIVGRTILSVIRLECCFVVSTSVIEEIMDAGNV